MTAHEDVADQIRALEDRRYRAITEGDVAALDELFAADFVYTHSDTKTDSDLLFSTRICPSSCTSPRMSPNTSTQSPCTTMLVSGWLIGPYLK